MTFRMAPCDVLSIDNTAVAPDREVYDDDPAAPRLMVGVWLDELGPG